MNNITIAVDAMGGDVGPSVTVPAALKVLAQHKNLHFILVGNIDVLQKELQQHHAISHERLSIHPASQCIGMDESPSQALRTKKDSSMRVALNLVKEGKAQACVSAGNTGALMATARFVLKTIPGIDRPAIISTFPTLIDNHNIRMLDLGANVDSSPEDLFQFAVMGSVLASAVDNIPNPKISLLNIGEEDIKGNELVKQAAQLLSQSKMLNYTGYIEGDALFKGNTDVVVCDGFVGNVALKTTEGVASFIRRLLKEAFYQNWLTKLIGLMILPIAKSVMKRLDPDRYNGATFIGLRGIVIKSHGGANVQSFAHALEEAIVQVDKNIPERVSDEIENLLKLSKSHSQIEREL